MQTPFGRYAELDRTDRELAYKILAFDKHQIVEGRVAEHFFDALLWECRGNPPLLTPHPLDIASASATGSYRHAFVLPRAKLPGLGRIFQCLEQQGAAYLVGDNAAGEFCAVRIAGGRWSWEEPRPWEQVAAEIGRGKPMMPNVRRSVRDQPRQDQGILNLDELFPGPRLWQEVVRPRLMLNFAVQPWFGATWNLDRICTVHLPAGDQTWLLEVKHKFPLRTHEGRLGFGLNAGEIEMIQACIKSGMHALHLIIVKPRWTREQSALTLFTDETEKAHALVIGLKMTPDILAELEKRPARNSPSHTQLEGRSKLAFKDLDPDWFGELGVLADPAQVTGNLRRLFHGQPIPALRTERLQQLRIQ